MSSSLTYEIRPMPSPDGGVRMGIFVEGRMHATATAGADELAQLEAQLGVGRDQVVEDLKASLESYVRDEFERVSISDIHADPNRPLRYSARSRMLTGTEFVEGLVWYDVGTSMTGPDDLSPVVRNKMRSEVHRTLTREQGTARALVDLHE